MRDVLVRTVREEGFRGLYRGVTVSTLKAVPGALRTLKMASDITLACFSGGVLLRLLRASANHPTPVSNPLLASWVQVAGVMKGS